MIIFDNLRKYLHINLHELPYTKNLIDIYNVDTCTLTSLMYGGPERTWCKYILSRYSDLASRYSDLTKSL